VHGPDGLNLQITPKDDVLQLEATAAGLPLPIAPDVTLSQFAMKGTATRSGMDIAEWGGAIFNGGVSGTARVRWGSTWNVEGVLTVRSINAAVFAPALLSEGNADGTGRFSMSGSDPAKLFAASRAEGRFTISKGTLGSFDLSRAIQSRGKQVTGTTQFAELNGQVTVDHGTVALRNVTIGAGALNAGATADITKGGALSGRIVADVRTAAQTLSATLNLGGTVKEPQVRD
jgi:autotransporter translocation and assembly factor TamB